MRLALILATMLAASAAAAQSWPAQPVKIVIGFPPGGTTDVTGRLVAHELSEQLGKPFAVAKGLADGHTLIVVPSTHGTARALYASLPYEESEFTAVGLVASTPYVFLVHPSMPVASPRSTSAASWSSAWPASTWCTCLTRAPAR